MIIVLFGAGLMLISCKKNELNADGTTNIESVEGDCGCNDLVLKDEDGNAISQGIIKTGETELFSGTCTEKDMNDSIIRVLEIKNGFIASAVNREKVYDKFITTVDVKYSYDTGMREITDGYILSISEDFDNKNFSYVGKCEIYKGKVKLEAYEISYWQGYDGGKNLKSKWEYNNGKRGVKEGLHLPKCMEDAEFSGRYGSLEPDYTIRDISPEDGLILLDCLKKELPMFNYWQKK